MKVVERVISPAPEGFRSPGGWVHAVEANALDDRLDALVGWSPWLFVRDANVAFNRDANTVTCSYEVPFVLPIRGAAR